MKQSIRQPAVLGYKNWVIHPIMPYGFAETLKEIKFDGSFSLETVPPAKLPPQIFEDMCKMLAKIAKEIVADI